MKAPQIIMLSLHFITLLIAANQHGKVKESKENFLYSLIGFIISLSILYWGVFFD